MLGFELTTLTSRLANVTNFISAAVDYFRRVREPQKMNINESRAVSNFILVHSFIVHKMMIVSSRKIALAKVSASIIMMRSRNKNQIIFEQR